MQGWPYSNYFCGCALKYCLHGLDWNRILYILGSLLSPLFLWPKDMDCNAWFPGSHPSPWLASAILTTAFLYSNLMSGTALVHLFIQTNFWCWGCSSRREARPLLSCSLKSEPSNEEDKSKEVSKIYSVVVWMRIASIGSNIWLLSSKLVELFGKDREVWPYWRKYATWAGFVISRIAPFPGCRLAATSLWMVEWSLSCYWSHALLCHPWNLQKP